MEDRERPSLFARIVTPPIFFLGGLAATLSFGVILYSFLVELSTGSEAISFNKGGFYMLGIGLGLTVIALSTGYESWIDTPLSSKWNRIVSIGAVTCVAIMLIVPHLTHFAVNTHLKNQGYTVCREASKQWLFVRTIVYTRSDDACLEISKD